jgi:hypothetical protein
MCLKWRALAAGAGRGVHGSSPGTGAAATCDSCGRRS